MGQDSLHFCSFARFLLVVARRLQESPNRLAGDAQANDTARSVDLSDRVGRDQLSPAGEEARADGEGVGNIRSGAVHRALEPIVRLRSGSAASPTAETLRPPYQRFSLCR